VAATCSRTATPGGAAAVSDGLVRSLRSSLSLRFLGFFCFRVGPSSLPVTLLCFFSFSSLPSLSFVLSLPLSLLCFFRFLLASPLYSLPLPSLLLCWLLFIEPSEWLFAVEHGGAAGRSAIGRDCSAPPPRLSGRCAVGGRPLRPVGGLQAREWPAKISKKSFPFSFFPAACSGGKKKDEQCRSKRHRSALFFFFFKYV